LYSEIIQYAKNKIVLPANIGFSSHSKFVIPLVESTFHTEVVMPKVKAAIDAEIALIMIKSINHATNLSDHLAMRSSLNTSESASDMN
jgi:hypothetical protein